MGLGLWNSVAVTVAVELLLFVPAVWLYAKVTRAADGVGRWSFWIFLAVVALIYSGAVQSGAVQSGAVQSGAVQGTPPTSVTALTATAFCTWLFPMWASWFDRHRAVAEFAKVR